jgi:hypothetical protein
LNASNERSLLNIFGLMNGPSLSNTRTNTTGSNSALSYILNSRLACSEELFFLGKHCKQFSIYVFPEKN